jgi:hypothetical protein
LDIPVFKPEFAFGSGYIQEYERVISNTVTS